MKVSIDNDKLAQLELRLAELERELGALRALIDATKTSSNGESGRSFMGLKGTFAGWLNADDALLEECRLKLGS